MEHTHLIVSVDADGHQELSDFREVDPCAERKISELFLACRAAILEACPEERQRNAALGLLPDAEAAQLRETIQAWRARYHAAAAAVNEIVAANAADESLMGRADACDAIDLVQL